MSDTIVPLPPSPPNVEATTVLDSEYFTIQRIRERYSRKLKTSIWDYLITFKNLAGAEHLIKDIFTGIIAVVTAAAPNPHNNYMRLILSSPSLSFPISLPFAHTSDITADLLLTRIANVMNSNETFVLDDGIRLNVFSVESLVFAAGTVGGVRKRKIIPLNRWGSRKKSIITIKVLEGDCLIGALEVAKKLIECEAGGAAMASTRRQLGHPTTKNNT